MGRLHHQDGHKRDRSTPAPARTPFSRIAARAWVESLSALYALRVPAIRSGNRAAARCRSPSCLTVAERATPRQRCSAAAMSKRPELIGSWRDTRRSAVRGSGESSVSTAAFAGLSGVDEMAALDNLSASGPTGTADGWKTRRRPVGEVATPEVLEDGLSIAGRLAWLGARLTIRPTLTIASRFPGAPWPWGLVDFAARAVTPWPGTARTPVRLAHCTAAVVRAAGVLPAEGTGRVVLYMHGGGFMTCGTNTHARLVKMLSNFADAPVLVANYRKIPRHSIADAVDHCYDGYWWLPRHGYCPAQIVLAGDSAGGHLGPALAQRLLAENEHPAALVGMSPLLQIDKTPNRTHPNIDADAMFGAEAFDALTELITSTTRSGTVGGHAHQIYEPLDHITPGLPPTLIHVSGTEVLLHDARLAAQKLGVAGVAVQLRVWPGQMHVFQLAAPIVLQATRSLRQIGEYTRAATDTCLKATGIRPTRPPLRRTGRPTPTRPQR